MTLQIDRPLAAFLWTSLSALGFVLMSTFVKRLDGEVPHMELVFFRSFVNFLIITFLMLLRREPFVTSNRRLLLFRGLMGFGGVTCFFYSLMHLPLSIASLINWASPIFVIIFSRFILKERLSARAMLWIGLAFIGLVLLIDPDFGSARTRLPLHGAIIAVLGAAFGGMAYVAVRAASSRVGVNAIVLYFTGTASILSLPLALQDFRVPDLRRLIELILVGVFASVGQIGLTHAYRHAAAGLVSTMGLMNAVFAMLFGWLFFSESLAPLQWIGMVLLGIGIASASRSRRTQV